LLICFSGFEVKVIAPDNYITRDSGLIYRDFEVGTGDCPKDGQQVFLLFSFQSTISFFIIFILIVWEKKLTQILGSKHQTEN
jgi:hypothetical protein